jgi:hypothetical protein
MHAIFLVAVLNAISYQSLIHEKVGLLIYITKESKFIKYTRDNEVLFRTNAVENAVIVAEH